jgi:hypothetical protein
MLSESGYSYGGLNHRYSKRKTRLVRLIDPITCEPVDFSTTLRADNWLLRNFCPGAWKCEVEPKHFRLLRLGAMVAPYCDLLTTFKDKVQIADLVVDVMTPQIRHTWEELQTTCKFFGVVPHLRMRAQVRENVTLLANLDTMRQHLVMYGLDSRYEALIQKHLDNDAVRSPAALYKVLVNKAPQNLIDSALFGLYRKGTHFINFAEVPYGPHSEIRHV